MSTTVYFRAANIAACDAWGPGVAAWNPNSAFGVSGTGTQIQALRLSRGAGATQISLATTASSTARFPFGALETGFDRFWVSPPLDRDVTIASTVIANLWVVETNMGANIQSGCYVAAIGADGTLSSVIGDGTAGAEMSADTTAPYSTSVQNFNITPSSTTVHKGSRLLIVPYFTNIGTEGSGYQGKFDYDGATAAAAGDSYVTFTEDFGFIETVGSLVSSAVGTSTSVPFGGTGSSDQQIAFPFRMASAQTISSITAGLCKNASPADNVVLAIQADSSGKPSGTDLSTGSTSGSALTSSPTFSYPAISMSAYALAADTLYWVVFRRSGANNATNNYSAEIASGVAVPPWNQNGWDETYNGSVWSSPNTGIRPVLTLTFTSGSTLYPTTAAGGVDPNGATYDSKDLWTSRGSGNTQATVNTAAAPASPLLFTTSAGGNYIEWFSKPLTAFTLAGAVYIFISRTQESNAAANATVGAEIAVCANDGTSPTVWGYTLHGLEALVSPSTVDREFFISGDDVSITDGQRLRLRIYADDASAAVMAASYTVTVTYAGTSGGGNGDTYLTFPITLTEYVSGTNYPQAVAASATGTMALVRKTGKPLAVAGSSTTALARKTAKPLPVSSTEGIGLSRTIVKPVAILGSSTAALARKTGKTLAATTTATLALATQKTKNVAVAVAMTFAVAFVRTVGKPVPVTASVTASLLRKIPQAIAATTTAVVGLARSIPKAVAATVTGTIALVRNIAKTIAPAGAGVTPALANTGEGGSNGTTVTAGAGGNSGGTSGDYFDAVTGAVTFSSTHPAHGSLGYKFVQNSTEANYLEWTRSLSGKTVYSRGYFYIELAGGTQYIYAPTDSAGSQILVRLRMTSGRVLQWVDNFGSPVGTTYTLSLDTLYRIETKVFSSGGAGTVEARIYLGDAASATATISATGVASGGNDVGRARHGSAVVAVGGALTCWWDDIAVGITDWLGVPGSGSGTAPAFTVGLTTTKVKTQLVAVAATVTAALARTTKKFIDATTTVSMALSRVTKKFIAVTSTITAALNAVYNAGSHAYNQAVDVASTVAMALVRRVGKPLASSLTGTVELATQKTKVMAIAVTTTVGAALSRVTRKTITVASTVTVAISRNVGKLMAFVPGVVMAVAKRTTRTIAASSTVTAGLSFIKALHVQIAASTPVTATLSAIKSVSQAIAVTSTAAVALVRRTGKAVAVAGSSTVALARKIAKPVAVAATLAVGLVRNIAKTVAVSVTDTISLLAGAAHRQAVAVGATLTVAIATAKTKLQQVAASMTGVVALARRTGKAVAVGASVSVALTRSIPKAVAVATTASVALVKRITHLVAVSLTGTVALAAAKTKVMAIAVTTTVVAALRRTTTHAVVVTSTLVAAISRNIRRTLAFVPGVVAEVHRGISHSVAAASTAVVNVVRNIGKAIASSSVIQAAIQASKIQGNQNYPVPIAVGLNVAVAVTRAIARQVAFAAVALVDVNKAMVKTIAVTTAHVVQVITARTRQQLVAVTTSVVATVGTVAGKLIGATTSVVVGLVRSISIRVQVALVLTPRVNKAITKTVEFVATLLADVRALFSGFATGKGHRGPTSARSTSERGTDATVGGERTDATVGGSQTDADEWG